jgi:hypothetical protein
MKSKIHAAVLLSLLGAALSVPALAQPVVTVDFTSPTKLLQTADALPRTLGGSGSYAFGTWVYSSVGEIDTVTSTGVAKIRNNAANNPRAISVIFNGALFTPGTEYTVSFDVIGNATGDNTGRFWLAEVSGYGASGTVVTNVAQGTTWAAATKPFTSTGTATLNFLTPHSEPALNGLLLEGENVAATSTTTFNFTYAAGTDIAFAVGTYNHIFSIDNFSIAPAAPIPEPSTYAMMAGLGALGLVLYRRRRGFGKH